MTQITPERLNELIDFHEQLRCKLAADHHITEACKADDVVQALRHYRELRASDAWQPIETAPKDGMTLYLWNGESMGEGSWFGWPRNPDGTPEGVTEGESAILEFGDRWEWGGEGFEIDPPPTHWRHLPSPPHE